MTQVLISHDNLPKAVHLLSRDMTEIKDLLQRLCNKPKKVEKEFITVVEAAKILDLAVQTIYGKVSKNEIPHIKKGNRLYFIENELIAWVNDGRVKTITEMQDEVHSYIK